MPLEVTNPPIPIPMVDYEQEISRYLSRVESVKGLISVLSMGSIKAPGLSDIDLICVVEDDFASAFAPMLSVRGLRRDLFLHGPVVVPLRLLKHLQFIIYASNLSTIWGQETHKLINEPKDDTARHLALAYTIDFSESRLIQYATDKRIGKIDMRRWMTRLWSLVHSKNLCDSAQIDLSKRSVKTIEKVVKLRKEWLEGIRCRENEFVQLFLESEVVLQEIFLEACQLAKSLLHPGESPPTRLIFTSANKRIICSESCQAPTAKVMRLPRITRMITTLAPATYAEHLLEYLSEEGYPGEDESSYACTLRRRRRYVTELNAFLESRQLSFAMGGYLGLRLPKENGLSETLYRWLWRILPR